MMNNETLVMTYYILKIKIQQNLYIFFKMDVQVCKKITLISIIQCILQY
jgi:hypothetical protein